MRRIFAYIILGGIVLIGLIQLVPYGHNHDNPAVVSEPAWDTPDTRALAVRACFDCHSNETIWPWYTQIAPISWLVQRDVDEGRARLNFSDWKPGRNAGRELGEVVLEGEMPPVYYVLTHPAAKLSDAEKQMLIHGMQGSLGQR